MWAKILEVDMEEARVDQMKSEEVYTATTSFVDITSRVTHNTTTTTHIHKKCEMCFTESPKKR